LPLAPLRFLAVATLLLENVGLDDREALDRSAVGRFYYAVYLQARLLLRSRGTMASTLESVARAFQAMPGYEDVGYDLRYLHGYRNRCDYDDTNEFSTIDATRAVLLARRIESRLASLG
jgi:uncharacterized protein (UPF0332 family)